jgi:gamma-glutamylcyclotransferase (GGCT)/AIG2-like uncharacterized protein YtfP
MNKHLFVYGSLMTALAHPMGDRLRREARLLGPARMAGRLHRVSWYPGLLPAQNASDLVHGEVYLLADPVHALHWLDEYEGIRPGGTSAAASDEYGRAERPATLADGTVVVAHIYLYQRPLPLSSWVRDGQWRG